MKIKKQFSKSGNLKMFYLSHVIFVPFQLAAPCHPDKYEGCVCDEKSFNCSEKGLTTIDLNHFEDDMITWM